MSPSSREEVQEVVYLVVDLMLADFDYVRVILVVDCLDGVWWIA